MERIALVTGANQGIGYALVEELAARLAPSDLVLLTGRNAAGSRQLLSASEQARSAESKAGCWTSPMRAP